MIPKAVVALAGARDYYQLPLALEEAGCLQTLVTDLYFPADRRWFQQSLGKLLPATIVKSRYHAKIPSIRVHVVPKALLAFGLAKLGTHWNLNELKDRSISYSAKQVAKQTGCAVFSYSYYASEVFAPAPDRPKYRFFFALQAHPASNRRLLTEEIERTPFARRSIEDEPEFQNSSKHFERLCNEISWANGWIAISSYAARTMEAEGVRKGQTHIAIFGVNQQVFSPRTAIPDPNEPFTVIFVGSITQRKGIVDLLEALRLLKSSKVRLVLCTKQVVYNELLDGFPDINLEVKIGLSGKSLANELYRADVNVFPSLTEGAGHVIFESMACGVPIIASTNTVAPDLIEQGKQGFIVPIRSPEAIAERLDWAIDHRAELAAMGNAAAARAQRFTWENFREQVRIAYGAMIANVDQATVS